MEERRQSQGILMALYGVRNFADKDGEDRAQWTRIGTAVPCRDGSWNLLFDYLPLQSGMTINMRSPKTAAGEGGRRRDHAAEDEETAGTEAEEEPRAERGRSVDHARRPRS